ncbi:transcription factor AP-4 isoform X2 [Schistocerca cancellata]|uniref:transcription factor AP-4 isoform X2 n=1 Tax=Schistocerca cancellata TaxID=274614 RepID=UPI0021184B2D|nr:transcription factor AP-4 isoform X2 [Schistocerca cancellata]
MPCERPGFNSLPGRGFSPIGLSERASSPCTSHMEQEKRIRREIANSNERRRMQSINAGFQSLRTLLPHHEGEKLSKAAILQQTAEYIYQLEQEKTSLLSQNCHLKRLLNRQEGQHEQTASVKRRKLESSMVVVSESSDEGIGSMSPEPAPVPGGAAVSAAEASRERDLIELRLSLDRERKLRMRLEDQVRALESQLYPKQLRDLSHQVTLHYHHESPTPHQVVTSGSGSVPVIGATIQDLQETAAAVAHLQVVTSRTPSPILGLPPPSPPPPPPPAPQVREPTPPPTPQPQRLPSVLEAAIKAEPKVEVERLPSPPAASDDVTPQSRLYAASTSRQNLETIVEAIRHLEGDQFISDEPTQEAPLALTTHRTGPTSGSAEGFLHFHSHPIPSQPQRPLSSTAALQQQRPGVIVVKQST